MTDTASDTFFQTEAPRPSALARRRLATQATWGAIAFIVLIVSRAPDTGSTSFYLGIGIAVMALFPIVRWTRKMDYNYPFFEILMGMYLPTYALPLISENEHARLFADTTVEHAALCVLLFQITALLTFNGLRFRPKTTTFWTASILHNFRPQLLTTGLVVTTVYVIVINYFWYPPGGLAGVLRAISFAVTTSSLFIAMMLWGRRHLAQRDKAIVVIALAIQFFILSSSLILRSGVSLVLIAMIGYFFGSRRVPWVAAITCLAIFAILHSGKFSMRGKYWFGNAPQTIQLTDLPAFYQEWVLASLTPSDASREESENSSLVERSSLIQMLCLVVSETPSRRPFLDGETYGYILGQFVPRFIWPNKPRGHVGTYRLAIYYGLQDESATESTTIAFGMLPEAYANYGMIGAIILGLALGGAYKAFTAWSLHSPIFSYPGFLIILFTAWSFQTELTMAAWLGSLSQAIIALIGGLFAATRFLRL